MTVTQYIGKATSRVDGKKKVTGQAKYTAEFFPENMVYGYVVSSTIASGEITEINISNAESLSGVLKVFTHENIPKEVKINADYSDPVAPPGKPFRPLGNKEILYNGQPIALVIAETFETARYAASLVKTTYKKKDCTTDIEKNENLATDKDVSGPPAGRGNVDLAFNNAPVKISARYSQPRHYQNPMEPHATVAIWDHENESFEIYDKIQGVGSSQKYVCGIFDLEKDKVRVKSPFLGGGFGSGLRPQYQLFMATMASKALKRPVKVTLTRRQMFSFGHRPANVQDLKLSANNGGKLTSIQHDSFGETSIFEKFSEQVVNWSGLMYECENVKLGYKLIPVNSYTPMDARGPGGVTGMFALECAIDELAEAANIDPLAFRIKNYAEKDQLEDKPFSSKELRACYEQAAQRFGWERRKQKAASTERGNQLVGYGMASGIWEAMQRKSGAKATLLVDGTFVVSSATADIGTGTYTVMSQIAAETLGVTLDKVTFQLGDTNLPKAPIEGGSWTVSSVGSAIKLVSEEMKKEVFKLVQETNKEEFGSLKYDEVTFENGTVSHGGNFALSFSEILENAKKDKIEVNVASEPDKERDEYSCFAHSCVMVEVNVDKDLGMVTIPRVVTAVAGGRIINPKTAESQILGGIVWGIGMALEEDGMMDDRSGRIMNANLAEYHLPVNADVQDLQVIFVEEEDSIVNPLGAKGLGEIGMVGVAAAIANAVYNATGKRVRNLPITLDKLI